MGGGGGVIAYFRIKRQKKVYSLLGSLLGSEKADSAILLGLERLFGALGKRDIILYGQK